MAYKIDSTYRVTQTQEFSVDCNGSNYLVIYGHHVNGGFIAELHSGVCTEAGDPTNTAYNAEKLEELFDDPETAKAIAEAVKEHWESIERTDPRNPHRSAPVHEREER